jgi:hypothetical protein
MVASTVSRLGSPSDGPAPGAAWLRRARMRARMVCSRASFSLLLLPAPRPAGASPSTGTGGLAGAALQHSRKQVRDQSGQEKHMRPASDSCTHQIRHLTRQACPRQLGQQARPKVPLHVRPASPRGEWLLATAYPPARLRWQPPPDACSEGRAGRLGPGRRWGGGGARRRGVDERVDALGVCQVLEHHVALRQVRVSKPQLQAGATARRCERATRFWGKPWSPRKQEGTTCASKVFL